MTHRSLVARRPAWAACQVGLEAFRLCCYLEQGTGPFGDADGHVGEGVDTLGQCRGRHRLARPRSVRDVEGLGVPGEGLVDDPAEQVRLGPEPHVDGACGEAGPSRDLGEGRGRVALVEEELPRRLDQLALGAGHPQARRSGRLRADPLTLSAMRCSITALVQCHCNCKGGPMIPTLAGVHHLKLPVSDLDRSIAWYASRLGYQVVVEFRKHGRRAGVSMAHPAGGPWLGLVLDPERARAAAGFDYFSIGVPDRARHPRVGRPPHRAG